MAKTQQDFLKEIVGGFMPQFNQQRRLQHEFLRGQNLRTGQSAGAATEALRPFAEASGQAAAKAGVAASSQAQRAQEFEKQRLDWQTQFDQGQTNWQAAFDQRNKDQAIANAMNMYQQTGVMTQEMLSALGLGDATRGSQRGVRTQLDILGLDGSDGGGGPRNRLRERALQPGPGIGGNTAQRRQQAWLQSQFG